MKRQISFILMGIKGKREIKMNLSIEQKGQSNHEKIS